ncbi:mCG144715, partial [Mus musculus]
NTTPHPTNVLERRNNTSTKYCWTSTLECRNISLKAILSSTVPNEVRSLPSRGLMCKTPTGCRHDYGSIHKPTKSQQHMLCGMLPRPLKGQGHPPQHWCSPRLVSPLACLKGVSQLM